MSASKSFLLSLLCVISFSFTAKAGCVQGDCSNGYGDFRFDDGARYVGDFYQGRLHGKGILYFPNGDKYVGNWEANKRQGNGKLTFANGDVYFGDFNENTMQGKGNMAFKSGADYDGDWRADKPHGKGIFKYQNGDKYVGAFVRGMMEGIGIMYFYTGAKYEGAWKANQRNGKGKMDMGDGKVIVGFWMDNRLEKEEGAITSPSVVNQAPPTQNTLRDCNDLYCADGYGTYKFSSGAVYEGTFENGQPIGDGKVQYADGRQYQGGWRINVPHGKGVMTDNNGKKTRGEWRHGSLIEVAPSAVYVNTSGGKVIQTWNPSVRIFAVIVGVSQYRTEKSLNFSDDDAYRMVAFLRSPEGGAIPESQIKVLIDEGASKEAILSALQDVGRQADADDVLMFYFSGHGINGAFLASDYTTGANLLYHADVQRIITNSKAKHKVVFADACHAGNLGMGVKGPVQNTLQTFYTAFENTKGGLAFFMSSKAEEISLEDGGLRSGIFSYYVIQGLSGKADVDTDYIVSIGELSQYVKTEVRNYSGKIQSPTLTGNFDPLMPVAVVRH